MSGTSVVTQGAGASSCGTKQLALVPELSECELRCVQGKGRQGSLKSPEPLNGCWELRRLLCGQPRSLSFILMDLGNHQNHDSSLGPFGRGRTDLVLFLSSGQFVSETQGYFLTNLSLCFVYEF